MPSRLDTFREHCRRMAEADHHPDCPSLGPPSRPVWQAVYDEAGGIQALRWVGNTPAPPTCGGGCMKPEDRALFAQLAAEVEEHQQLTLEDA